MWYDPEGMESRFPKPLGGYPLWLHRDVLEVVPRPFPVEKADSKPETGRVR